MSKYKKFSINQHDSIKFGDEVTIILHKDYVILLTLDGKFTCRRVL